MQFIDLKTQYQRIEEDVRQGINAVLEHGRYIMGPEIEALEALLAEYVGVKHTIAVSSGTDALLMSLLALDVQAGDEVITTPFSFFSTGETISLIGAKPVFVDIDPKTYNLDANLIEAAITDNTKAIMPVSLYGQCADYDAINAVAKKYNLPVIEDAAQSFGATYKGRRSCGLTTIGCTSFFPSKPLGGYGDSGACFTNDDELAERLIQIRNHGQSTRYHHIRFGINGRMDSMQAAVLLAKMKIFPEEAEIREAVGRRYTELLNGIVATPYIAAENTSVYAQYTIESEKRQALADFLSERGVPTAVHYPKALHQQPVYQGITDKTFPHAEAAAERVISLPLHPYLAYESQQQVADTIREFING